jgi:hypothetical protein
MKGCFYVLTKRKNAKSGDQKTRVFKIGDTRNSKVALNARVASSSANSRRFAEGIDGRRPSDPRATRTGWVAIEAWATDRRATAVAIALRIQNLAAAHGNLLLTSQGKDVRGRATDYLIGVRMAQLREWIDASVQEVNSIGRSARMEFPRFSGHPTA